MHVGIVLVVILCMVIGLLAFLIFLLAPRLSGRKRVHPFLGVKWAHRGLHDKKRGIPENSFPAFRAAIEAGDGIELDVHLTKDGQLVVFHDDTFERICGRRGRVEDTSYEEIQTCGDKRADSTIVRSTAAGRWKGATSDRGETS